MNENDQEHLEVIHDVLDELGRSPLALPAHPRVPHCTQLVEIVHDLAHLEDILRAAGEDISVGELDVTTGGVGVLVRVLGDGVDGPVLHRFVSKETTKQTKK